MINDIITSLKANVSWFLNSGIMCPNTGKWGVAERVVTKDNQALTKVLKAFPYHTERPDSYVLEHRRPDCNFEAAWYFARCSEALEQPELFHITENILDYLFHRSGLLNKSYPDLPPAMWEWCTNNLKNQFYYDDNAWNAFFELALARRYPQVEEKFQLRTWGLELCQTLATGLEQEFFGSTTPVLSGKPELPHWGALACMAIASGAAELSSDKLLTTVERYYQYLQETCDKFNASEYAYTLLAGSVTTYITQSKLVRDVTLNAAQKLLEIMTEAGNIPSEHYEIPNGPQLIDLVYTVNWAVLGFQSLTAVDGNPVYQAAYDKLKYLLLQIQDLTSAVDFRGAWRGLYDLDRQAWAGGDLHEGGSGSLYSGWTNIPIALCWANDLLGETLPEAAMKFER